MKKIPQDIIGDIAVLKFSRRTPWFWKKYLSWRFLKENKNVNVVLEKAVGFSGELRKQETKWLAGEKRKVTIHKENGCKFKVNIDGAYFSPRLSSHRKEVCEEIVGKICEVLGLSSEFCVSHPKFVLKHSSHPSRSLRSQEKNSQNSSKNKIDFLKKSQKKIPKILVMFAGVAPWTIILAKFLKQKGIDAEIYSNELNKEANELARENVRLNKVSDYVKFVDGDANDLPKKLKSKRFDFILMPRPNLEDTFLESALKLSHRSVYPKARSSGAKGTEIYYHGFGTEEEVLKEISEFNRLGAPTHPNPYSANSKTVRNVKGTQASKKTNYRSQKKIVKIEKMEKAGDIGKGIWRWLVVLKVR